MINKLKIKNFKIFKEEEEIDFNNLTILSGLNSGGKSSIYQILLLLAQSSESYIKFNGSIISTLELNGKLIQLGMPEDILSDKNNKLLEIEIEWDTGYRSIYVYELTSHINNNREKFILKEMSLALDGDNHYLISRNKDYEWCVEGCRSFEFSDPTVSRVFYNLINSGNQNIKFKNIKEIFILRNNLYQFFIKIEDIIECISQDERDQFDLLNFKLKLKEEGYEKKYVGLINSYPIVGLDNVLSENNIEYIPPFRGSPKRIYLEENPLDELLEVDKNEKFNYEFDLENSSIKNGTIEEALKYWVVDKFKIAEDVEVSEPIKHLASEIIFTINNKKISLNNVGFGVSQIIPVIFKVLINNNKILIVDEPEIHLHPNFQSLLGEFFFKMMLINKFQIIETHSEYLLEKLIYFQLKYKDLCNDKCNMFWVHNSKIEKIKFDELGYFLNAPEFFMSERDKLIKELSELRMEKLING